jgi:hypothetical protein
MDFPPEIKLNLPSPSLDIFERNVKQRNMALAKVQQGLTLLSEAMDIAPAMAYETMLRNNINWYNVGEVPQKNLDIAKRTTDRAFWKQLLKESKLGITMNSEQYEKILEDIEKHPVELQYDVAVETFTAAQAA